MQRQHTSTPSIVYQCSPCEMQSWRRNADEMKREDTWSKKHSNSWICPSGSERSWNKVKGDLVDSKIRFTIKLVKLRLQAPSWNPFEVSGWTLYTCSLILFLFFFFWKTRVWTQGFSLAKQTLYHFSHTSSPFCSGYFGDGGVSQTICLGWPLSTILPISVSQVAKITGMSHQH
jgi:hypothetical protein